MFRILSVALLALLLLAAPAAAQSGSTAGPFQNAFNVAQHQVPGGQLLMARVEGANYGFYFYVNGHIIEVEISGTGKVIKYKDEKDPNDIKDIPPEALALLGKRGKTKMPAGRLMEIAADNLKDTPLSSMFYAVVDDRLVFRAGDLVLDADTGKVISTKKK